MPAYHVEKSILIKATTAQVISAISDFEQWPTWSPWLILEPECQLSYSGTQGEVGAGYAWQGDMVGSGKMQLEQISQQQFIMSLTFLTPFKSEAKVVFDLEEQGEDIKLTWHMYGSLPFYLFFMKKMMQAWIGMDYQRGLCMLKAYVETGEVSSTPEIVGYAQQGAQYFIGLSHSATLDKLGPVMREHFTKLNDFISEKGIEVTGVPFALYHKMDMTTTESSFTSAIPIGEKILVPAPFECQQLPTGKVWQVKHTGHYQFLGNAWALAMMASKHQKVKTRKKPMGMERYLNDPTTTSSEALITEVVLFCK